ncbi:MAG: DHA2 family efflux MFS transporter permease subunit [Leptolyngbya sp. BL-A-14]
MNPAQNNQLPTQAPQPTHTTAAPRPDQVSPARALLGVIIPVLGSLLTTLDLQMTNACLKDVQGALGFSADEGTWVSIAYTSAELVSIPLAGWLSRAFSRRWYLSVNAGLFVGCAIACAQSWDLTSFMVFRTLQGLVAGGFLVSAFTIVITQMPRSKQHLGLVMVGITSSLPVPIGQLLGGWFVDNYNWQFIYYVSVPLGLLLVLGLWHWLDPQPMKLAILKQIDWFGSVLLALALTCCIAVLQRGNTENWFDSEWIIRLSLTSIFFLGLFCGWELAVRSPLIDIRLLEQPNFAFANLLNLSVGLVLAYTFVLPQYLGQIQGYNTVQIGTVLIWGAVVNPFVPKLVEHVEARLVLAIGLSIFVISCFMNVALSHDNGGGQFVWSQVIRAIGQPVMVVAISFIATNGIQKAQADSVSAIYNGVRVVAGTLGTALLGTLLTKREQFHSSHIVETVSSYSTQAQDRLQQLSQFLTAKLGDPNAAQVLAASSLGQTIRREAYVMAYSDCFYFIGISLILVGVVIFFLKRSSKPGEVIH